MLLATESWAAKPFCGDGVCKGKETYENCKNDCFLCGDGTCNTGEDSDSCPVDCYTPPPDPISFVLGPHVLSAHHGDPVRAVGFANYGTEQVISGGEDEYLIARDLELTEEGKIEILLSHTIYDLDSSVDGTTIATGVGGWNGGTDVTTLRTFDTTDYSSPLAETRAPIGYVYSVAISPDNYWTVASGFYGDIVVYDTTSLTLYATKSTKKKRTKALAFSPDGSILASTSTAGMIQLWSFPSNCNQNSCELNLLPVSLRHSGSWAFPIAFYPDIFQEATDKIKIASSSDSGVIKVWTIEDTTDPTLGVPITVDTGSVYCLDWSPDGEKIVAGGNGSITVYAADSLEIISQRVDAHTSRVNDVAFSSDSSMIVSGGQDGSLKLWTLE